MIESTESKRTAETSAGHAMAIERTRCRTGGSRLRQLMSNWWQKTSTLRSSNSIYRYEHIFTKYYERGEAEKVPIIKKQFGEAAYNTCVY